MLYFSCFPLAGEPKSVNGLTEYKSSPKLTRYFCPSCGSPMFIHTINDDSWSLCSGVVDRVVGHEQVSCLSLERIMQHEFVGDTTDGGLAVCLGDLDTNPVPLFLQGPDGTSLKSADITPETMLQGEDPHASENVSESNTPNTLQAGCHCGGVSFHVTRPDPASKACSSPWPDLLVPYHSSSSDNPEDIKWWLRAHDSKYLAGTCACRSCRLGSGSPIQAWAFIPKANVFQLDGKPLDYRMGSLKQYESSKDIFREFCGGCGATVFWHCLERPDLVDVSVGLLRANEGARASHWLDWWTERVSFIEDALDKTLINHLEARLKNIGAEAH